MRPSELIFATSTTTNNMGLNCRLTLDQACMRVTRQLNWYGLAHLRLEQIFETNDGMLGVLVRDRRDQSIVSCVIDPKIGAVRFRLCRISGMRDEPAPARQRDEVLLA